MSVNVGGRRATSFSEWAASGNFFGRMTAEHVVGITICFFVQSM